MNEQLFGVLPSRKKDECADAILYLSFPIINYKSPDETDNEDTNTKSIVISDPPHLLQSYLKLCNLAIKFYDNVNSILREYHATKSAAIITKNTDKETKLENQVIRLITNQIVTLKREITNNLGYAKSIPPSLMSLELFNTQGTQPEAEKLARLIMDKNQINTSFKSKIGVIQNELASEVVSLYKKQNLRIRNCHKRYASAMEKFRLLPPNGQYYLIQLNFAIKDAIFEEDKVFFNTETSKNFVNRFIALRNKKPYKPYFSGLVGYMKKLILTNDKQANGGMISLVFNQSNPYLCSRALDIKSNYLEFAQALNNSLCYMAKEDGIALESGFSARFLPPKFTHSDCIEIIPKIITFYAYSDFVTSFKDNDLTPNPKAYGTLRAFEVSFSDNEKAL